MKSVNAKVHHPVHIESFKNQQRHLKNRILFGPFWKREWAESTLLSFFAYFVGLSVAQEMSGVPGEISVPRLVTPSLALSTTRCETGSCREQVILGALTS